jgi:hypothetical protein
MGRFLHAQAKQLTLISFFCPCMMHMITASENWEPLLQQTPTKKLFTKIQWLFSCVAIGSNHYWNKLFHKKPVSFWVKSIFHDTLQSSHRVNCNGITESVLVESFQGIQDKQEGHNLRKFQKHSIVTWCMGVEMLQMVCTCGDGKDMVLFITCKENTACIHKICAIIWVHTVRHSKHAKY